MRFMIQVRQFVEEVSVVEIEADTIDEAVASVAERLRSGELDVDWADGDGESQDREPYAAFDDKGRLVWDNTKP